LQQAYGGCARPRYCQKLYAKAHRLLRCPLQEAGLSETSRSFLYATNRHAAKSISFKSLQASCGIQLGLVVTGWAWRDTMQLMVQESGGKSKCNWLQESQLQEVTTKGWWSSAETGCNRIGFKRLHEEKVNEVRCRDWLQEDWLQDTAQEGTGPKSVQQ